ncbi:MAG: MlaC/ttg2D family ABC transporter substrate-binding protein [Rhizomicrobium sp.]
MRKFHAALGAMVRIVLLAVALAGFGASAASAQGSASAEAYIQTNIQRGLDILDNHALAPADRRDQFRAFLESLTDFNRVALFTLGAAARTASDADKSAFEAAFHDYAVAVYNSRLSRYDGQVLKVTGSMQNKPGDFSVHCVMTDPHGGAPTQIDFRVLSDGGKFVLMDASVEGIWLAIEERDQFVSFLGNHNGDIHALIEHLNTLTARESGGR